MPCNETFFNATKGRYGLDYSTLMCNGPFYLSYWLHDSALTIKITTTTRGLSRQSPRACRL